MSGNSSQGYLLVCPAGVHCYTDNMMMIDCRRIIKGRCYHKPGPDPDPDPMPPEPNPFPSPQPPVPDPRPPSPPTRPPIPQLLPPRHISQTWQTMAGSRFRYSLDHTTQMGAEAFLNHASFGYWACRLVCSSCCTFLESYNKRRGIISPTNNDRP